MKRRGFTIVEVMVASMLALVILALAVQLFIPALRAWSEGQKRSEVDQNLLVASCWIGDDVTRCSPGSIRLTDQGALAMKCAQGQTTDHTNPFSQMVVYWQDQTDLLRATLALDDPDAEPSLALNDVRAWSEQRRVASDVSRFEVTIPDAWRLTLNLQISKSGRSGEIRTAFSSAYAPLDLEYAQANQQQTP